MEKVILTTIWSQNPSMSPLKERFEGKNFEEDKTWDDTKTWVDSDKDIAEVSKRVRIH